MTEYVEKSLQECLPELKFMKDIGLFTDQELGKILKKRREHEYKIRRRTKELKEYIEYIEYEKLVLELIQKRRKKMNCYSEKRKIEIPIYKRIRRLFQNACTRFPQCADLWVKQIEFCLEKNETQMIGLLFTNALRLHPNNESIWIMAAKYEMQQNFSMSGARNFLQRALRQNTKSRKLYLEYFKMELLNAEKYHNEASKISLDGEEKQEKTDEDVDDEEVKKGSVALAVFEAAVEEITGDLNFFLDFINICVMFPFAEWIITEIYKKISDNPYWENKEEASAFLSIKPVTLLLSHLKAVKSSNSDDDEVDIKIQKIINIFPLKLKECRELFETAHETFNSEDMWHKHYNLLIEASKQAPSPIKIELLKEAMLVCCESFERDMMSELLAEKWMGLLKTDDEFAREIAPLLVNKWPSSNQAWIFMFQRLTSLENIEESRTSEVIEWLKRCNSILKKEEDLEEIWKMVSCWLVLNHYKKIEKFFQSGLLSGCRSVKKILKEHYLEWAIKNKEISEVRKLFEKIFKTRPNSQKLLNIYLKAELSQAHVNSTHIRRAYETAALEFGDSSIDFWLDYIKFEATAYGSPQLIGQTYYKAIKCLNKGLENEFIEKYSVLKAQNYEK